MLNEQQRQSDQVPQPPNVVVTTPSPTRPVEAPRLALNRPKWKYTPRAARIKTNSRLIAEHPRCVLEPTGLRQRRFGVGKTIDLCWYVLGVLEIVLATRFFFELTEANAACRLR